MRVLLLTTNTNNSENPPLGLYLLKSYTEKNMDDRNITIDVHALIRFNHISILKLVLKYKPDVLGFGCYVWNSKLFMEMCRKVKKIIPKITIIMGGPSITRNDPELDVLLEKNIVNYMIIGEGERIFYEIVKNMYDGEEKKNNNLPNCMGRKENGEIFKGAYDKEWRCNLNTLPNPFFIYDEFREATKKYGCVTLETSRGCPYNCAYCVESQIPFYSKDICVVLNELECLYNMGIENVALLDATLNFNIKRTKELFRAIIEKGWKFDFSFEVKAECLDIELMNLMTGIGVRKIEIGLQSSNKSTLRRISRYFDEKKFITNIKMMIDSKINIVVDLIAGLPEETLEDCCNSIDYCYQLGNIDISSNLLKVLPGTMIYEQIGKYKYRFDQDNMNTVLETSTMTVNDIGIIKKMIIVLNYFWTFEDVEWKQHMREICDKNFSGSLSKLIMEITTFMILKEKTIREIMESREMKEILLKDLLNNYMDEEKLCLK